MFVSSSTRWISSITSHKINLNMKVLSSIVPQVLTTGGQTRSINVYQVRQPYPADKRFNYRYNVFYPKDGKYTTDHLERVHCLGMDPFTGRKIVGTSGTGRLPGYRWIDFNRCGPSDGSVKEERIIEVQFDPNRSPFIALVGSGSHLRYILATTTMQIGGIVRSSSFLPETPITGVEGDSYPLGALPVGTLVCNVEMFPGKGGVFLRIAGAKAKIVSKLTDGKVVIKMPSNEEMAFDPHCNAVCGQISNPDFGLIHVGSPNRLRWLGHYPRSGLWQRKDGYKGRKVRAPKPMKHFRNSLGPLPSVEIKCPGEGTRDDFLPKAKRVT